MKKIILTREQITEAFGEYIIAEGLYKGEGGTLIFEILGDRAELTVYDYGERMQ